MLHRRLRSSLLAAVPLIVLAVLVAPVTALLIVLAGNHPTLRTVVPLAAAFVDLVLQRLGSGAAGPAVTSRSVPAM